MKKQISIEEIKRKLMWFHGEEFEKYPFIYPNKENNRQYK
jgi:hypothetical protein